MWLHNESSTHNLPAPLLCRCGCRPWRPKGWRSPERSLGVAVRSTWTWLSPTRPWVSWLTSPSSSTGTGENPKVEDLSITDHFHTFLVFLFVLRLGTFSPDSFCSLTSPWLVCKVTSWRAGSDLCFISLFCRSIVREDEDLSETFSVHLSTSRLRLINTSLSNPMMCQESKTVW